MSEGSTTETVPQEGAPADAADRGVSGGGDEDPGKLREMLSAARAEAASYRIRLRETREQLQEYVSPADHEAVTRRVAELEAELSRRRLAAKYGLPERIAARIMGDSDEEREADAKVLAEELRMTSAAEIRVGRGGLDPAEAPLPTDPARLAAMIRRSRS